MRVMIAIMLLVMSSAFADTPITDLTLQSDANAGGYSITNSAPPVNPDDLATKGYVDELVPNRIAIVNDDVWTWYSDADISVLTNMVDNSVAYIYGGTYTWSGVDHATDDTRIKANNISIIGVGRPLIVADLLESPSHASGMYITSTNGVLQGIDLITYPDIDDPAEERLHYGLTVTGSEDFLIDDCGIYMVSTSEQYSAKTLVGVNAYNTRVVDSRIGMFADGYVPTSGQSLSLTATHSTVTDRDGGLYFDGCSFMTQPDNMTCSVGRPFINLSWCRANSMIPSSGSAMKYAVAPLSYEGARASVPAQIRSLIDRQYYKLPFGDDIRGFVSGVGYLHNELGDAFATYQAGTNGAYWETQITTDVDRIVSLAGRIAYDNRGTAYEIGCKDRTTDICLAGEHPTEIQFRGVATGFYQASNITCRVEGMSFTQVSTSGNLFAVRMNNCTNSVLIVENCDFFFPGANSLTAPAFEFQSSTCRVLVQNCRVALGANDLYVQPETKYLNCAFWEGDDFLGAPSFTIDVAGKRWAASSSAPTGGNVKEGDYYYDTVLNSPGWYNGSTWDYN